MNRSLTDQELTYVVYHLALVMDVSLLKEKLIYADHTVDLTAHQKGIVFLASTGELSPQSFDGLPVLFPSKTTLIYEIDVHGNLVFHQDLLKSSFYLLSDYHGIHSNADRDHWGRVKYNGSIQRELDIIHRPLVNEYFELILEGVNAYLHHHGLVKQEKKKLFENFGFLLSHDIDVIDKFGWPHLGYKIKELFGIAKTNHTPRAILKATIESFFQFINPKRSNPYWNFDYLMNCERSNNLKASYYFLSKDQIGGSSYEFHEERMIELFKNLKEEGHEIGIHGTTSTVKNSDLLHEEIRSLEKSAAVTVKGGRQHRLWLQMPQTFRIHEKVGLKYDSSFGFAEQEGFRNSFCLPYKPYDFEKKEMINVWQFPLIVMDVTLFSYRTLDQKKISAIFDKLLNSVSSHHGIFTLLWHNSFFDDVLYPGVKTIYEKLLKKISEQYPTSLTGADLVEILNQENEI